MIYSLFIFHRNRCIFIAQYPQRGSALPASVSDPSAAAAAAAAAGPQQQHRSSSTARGSSARATTGPSGAAAAAAAQQTAAAFPQSASLQQRIAGGSTLVVAAPAAAAAAAAAGTATGGAAGASSLPPGTSSLRVSSCDPLGGATTWRPLTKRQQQTGRLLAGLLYSMRRFCEQIGPSVSPSNSSSSSSSSFNSFTTANYKLHYFETPTGYGFACLSSRDVPYLYEALQHIYVSLFLELILKSPSFIPAKQIDSPVFAEHLHMFLSSLPAWDS